MAKREGIMLCQPFEEKRLEKWNPPYLLQPKLDGERCRALISSSGVLLISSEKNLITSVPHIQEAISNLNLPEGTELDGELYIHNLPFEEIHSIVSRKVSLHPEASKMGYHIFDIIPVNNPALLQGDRYVLLGSLKLTPPLYKVKAEIVDSLESIFREYDNFLSLGYEGIILRNIFYSYERKRSTGIMKFKPKKLDHYEIIELEEAISQNGVPKQLLGAFVCRGSDGTAFKVGAGKLDHEERRRIWDNREDYIHKLCEVQYQNLTSEGIPRFGLCVREPKEQATSDEASMTIRQLFKI